MHGRNAEPCYGWARRFLKAAADAEDDRSMNSPGVIRMKRLGAPPTAILKGRDRPADGRIPARASIGACSRARQPDQRDSFPEKDTYRVMKG